MAKTKGEQDLCRCGKKNCAYKENHNSWHYADLTLKWINTALDAGYLFKGEHRLPDNDDVVHSSLLDRLVRGGEPLPFPPPTKNGYPWYELIDNGQATVVSFSRERKEPYVVRDDGMIVLEGNCGPWNILEIKPNGALLLEFFDEKRAPGKWLLCIDGQESREEIVQPWTIRRA